MAIDISGIGLQVQIVASNTFPNGINITQFADDADPMDSAAVQIADSALGLNGELIKWSVANKIPLLLNVIPGSDDDINLSILGEANRVGRGKTSARDIITAVVIYPGEQPVTLTEGHITDIVAVNSTSGAGRRKTKPFTFSFENKSGI